MRTKLKTQQGEHPAGSEHEVLDVVPHGGNYDDARQYVIAGQTHVPESKAEVIEDWGVRRKRSRTIRQVF